MIQNRIDEAINVFDSGKNCAQSVLTGCSNIIDYNLDQATSLARGMGGGMGGMQYTCGAVTGAIMALGYHCNIDGSDPDKNIQEFTKRFKKNMNSLDCSSLTNCDFSTKEGAVLFKRNNIREKVCHKCIIVSIQIVNELVKNNS